MNKLTTLIITAIAAITLFAGCNTSNTSVKDTEEVDTYIESVAKGFQFSVPQEQADKGLEGVSQQVLDIAKGFQFSVPQN